jgi:molybdate transport system substrate-binding protein
MNRIFPYHIHLGQISGRISGRILIVTLGLMLLALLGGTGAVRAQPTVTVFAAASLKNALDDVAARFERTSKTRVSLSYGASSALARQIQYGAPAQIFVSANILWMDSLQNDGLLVSRTRVNLLANRLVLIAHRGSGISLTVEPGMDLVGALQGDRLALALIQAVPAGVYARAALQSLGIWDQVKDQTAQTDNVRAALRLVAVGEAPLGIVYATDATVDADVRALGLFPKDSHPPILYPAARLAQDDSAASQAFFAFLTGPEALAVFQQYGFTIPAKDTP